MSINNSLDNNSINKSASYGIYLQLPFKNIKVTNNNLSSNFLQEHYSDW